jgi:methylated-DNA-protein-cysteine methyltransferase-like protein
VAKPPAPQMSTEEYVEAVLSYVERIPPGRVTTYGAIADALADASGRNSARQIGTIMARHGGSVPWHRVVGAGGRLVPGHENEARRLLKSEGVPFRGERVSPEAFL